MTRMIGTLARSGLAGSSTPSRQSQQSAKLVDAGMRSVLISSRSRKSGRASGESTILIVGASDRAKTGLQDRWMNQARPAARERGHFLLWQRFATEGGARGHVLSG